MYNTYMLIYYTGIGAKPDGKHTEAEFLAIMNREVAHRQWGTYNRALDIAGKLKFKDWILPDDFVFFTLNDWLEYSGAEQLAHIVDTQSKAT